MAYSSANGSNKSENFDLHFRNVASVVAGQIRLTLATSHPFQPRSMISADKGFEYVRIKAAVFYGFEKSAVFSRTSIELSLSTWSEAAMVSRTVLCRHEYQA
ncbi:hypothetical protein ABIE89_000435 [Bradyrhizobium niftali]|uniref:hypothetical protein n=1 Tax=Bradyrhizobium niftali TaxID=2560055 RepID=UPI003836E4AB